MSLLNKIGGFFVETEKPKPKASPKDPPSFLKPNTPIPTDSSVTSLPSGDVVAHFRSRFAQLMEEENKRNYPGIDFYEFRATKNAMSAIPQEDIRYTSAFAGLVHSGLTKDKLIETAHQYLKVIEREKEEFNAALTHMNDTEVSVKLAQVEKNNQEMAELSKRINTLAVETNNLKEEALEASTKLTSREQAFQFAAKAEEDSINEEIQKINLYIK
jgi:hypothetical protein